MATLKLEIPDGLYCIDCIFLDKMIDDPRESRPNKCKIFECRLGNKLKDIFKCPMCIEQSRKEYKPNNLRTPLNVSNASC